MKENTDIKIVEINKPNNQTIEERLKLLCDYLSHALAN